MDRGYRSAVRVSGGRVPRATARAEGFSITRERARGRALRLPVVGVAGRTTLLTGLRILAPLPRVLGLVLPGASPLPPLRDPMFFSNSALERIFLTLFFF